MLESTSWSSTRRPSTVIQELRAAGYTCDLSPLPDGLVHCAGTDIAVPAQDVRVDWFQRFEGESDPDDMQLVAAVRLSHEGRELKGVLMLSYGPLASPEDGEVLTRLRMDSDTRVWPSTGSAPPGSR